jgi:hypothetical protein
VGGEGKEMGWKWEHAQNVAKENACLVYHKRTKRKTFTKERKR